MFKGLLSLCNTSIVPGRVREHKIPKLKCVWRLKGSFYVKVLFIQRETLAYRLHNFSRKGKTHGHGHMF